MPVSLLSPADMTSPRVGVGCGAATPVRPGSELEKGETGIPIPFQSRQSIFISSTRRPIMMIHFCKRISLALQGLTAIRNVPESQRGALTIEWGQIIAIIVIVLLAVGAILQAFIPGFFQSILDKLGS
jgi:Flp pilus assembly pilin Flp